ncbi:MAG: hypothetical protein HYY42_02670, partial [Chloroflexi bacterium]|nr:hypothetical protein [Chloroflexota bacterium]
MRSWTDAQNARTRAVLDGIPQRARFAARLRELLAVGLMDTPRKVVVDVLHGEHVADPYRWLEDASSERLRSWTSAQNARTRAVLDRIPDPAGLTTIDWWYPSRDGSLVAYGLSRGGNEMSTLHVIEAATGRVTGARIDHTQRASVAGTRDGFFYTAHP